MDDIIMTDSEIKTKTIDHPLEELFDIQPGTTVVEYNEVKPLEVKYHEDYDDKDNEIETQLNELYAIAIQQSGDLTDQIETVEGKYKSRLSETSAQLLNVALGAVREKSALKQHKDKIASRKSTSGVTNNNLVVASHSEILQMLRDTNKK